MLGKILNIVLMTSNHGLRQKPIKVSGKTLSYSMDFDGAQCVVWRHTKMRMNSFKKRGKESLFLHKWSALKKKYTEAKPVWLWLLKLYLKFSGILMLELKSMRAFTINIHEARIIPIKLNQGKGLFDAYYYLKEVWVFVLYMYVSFYETSTLR